MTNKRVGLQKGCTVPLRVRVTSVGSMVNAVPLRAYTMVSAESAAKVVKPRILDWLLGGDEKSEIVDGRCETGDPRRTINTV